MRVDVVVQATDASGNRSISEKAIWLKAQPRR
jgi:hypothetical protein